MIPNIPLDAVIEIDSRKEEIRLIILEAWQLGEVVESDVDQDLWLTCAKELSDSLDVRLDAIKKEHLNGIIYLRANHGFPIEMIHNSPQARHWLSIDPARREYRNMMNDLFIGCSLA